MESANRGVGSTKDLIIKTWERCMSAMGKSSKPKSTWIRSHRVSPEGFFPVCVGVGKVKYVVRTECLNHPLFRTLLDEAEMEYGYAVTGPLELPCDVDHFENVLTEVESGGGYYDKSDDVDVKRRRSFCCLSDVWFIAHQFLSPAAPSSGHGTD